MSMPLVGVYLMSVCLTGMHLMGVYLVGVHLMGMHLMGVHLVSVHLIGMHLKGLHLSYELYELYNCSQLKNHVALVVLEFFILR